MAQLVERDQFEQQAFRRLSKLSAQHRREIEAYLGNPPNLRNVPTSFWDRVEQETNAELAAILILIMMASAIQEGVPADFASAQSGGWGRIRASFAARRMMQTTVKQLNATQEVWNAEIAAGKKIGVTRIRADLMKVLGPERMGTVAVTETTKAASAGTLLAAGRGSAAVASQYKVIWTLGNCDHCEFCERMAGTDQSYWSKYSDGPPSHPHCCCTLSIVPRDTASRTPDPGEPDTEGLFESDHQTCRAMVDLLVMGFGGGADGGFIAEFVESDHPRADNGRFVSGDSITSAAGNPAKENKLRDSVTDPQQREKLDRELLAARGKSPDRKIKVEGSFKPPIDMAELNSFADKVESRTMNWTKGQFRSAEAAIKGDGKKRRLSLQKVSPFGTLHVEGREFAIDKAGNLYSRKSAGVMDTPEPYKIDNESRDKVKSAVRNEVIDQRTHIDSLSRKFDKPSIDLASKIADMGVQVRVSVPDDSTSRYVFATLPSGGEYKIRFADHPQPRDWVDGKLQTVGGFDTKRGKRHTSSDISIDPESGATVDDAIKMLDAAIKSGKSGRVHESFEDIQRWERECRFIAEAFNESDHPRDDHGKFVSSGAITLAAGNPAKEKALRDSVTDPKEREKLDRDLKAAGGGVASTQAFTDGGKAETGKDDASPRSDKTTTASPRPETPRSKERVAISQPRKITETKGINSSYVVDLEGDKRGVYKPASGDAKIADHGWDPEMWHPQTMHKSEVAASVLDEIMGLGMVPKTALADGELGIGSVQEWSNGKAAVENGFINYKVLDRVSEEGMTKLAAFDLLIGNPDRHYGNVLADGDKPVAIDNGMGFPKHNEPYIAGKYALKGVWPPKFYAEKLPQDFQDSLGKLLSDRETVTRELKPFLEDDQLQAFWKRAEVLHKHSDNFRKIAPPHDQYTGNAFDGGRALKD
jgi:hypothetical protein